MKENPQPIKADIQEFIEFEHIVCAAGQKWYVAHQSEIKEYLENLPKTDLFSIIDNWLSNPGVIQELRKKGLKNQKSVSEAILKMFLNIKGNYSSWELKVVILYITSLGFVAWTLDQLYPGSKLENTIVKQMMESLHPSQISHWHDFQEINSVTTAYEPELLILNLFDILGRLAFMERGADVLTPKNYQNKIQLWLAYAKRYPRLKRLKQLYQRVPKILADPEFQQRIRIFAPR